MPLPKIETPTFELELPSTGDKIKYRPFLVKEQKNLLIAQQSGNQSEMQNAIAQCISDCTFNQLSPQNLPMFDVEYLFVKIRCKSVGENVELSVLCPDDEKTRVDVAVNLDEIEVQVQEDHTNEVIVSDDVKLYMRYPYLNDMMSISETDGIAATFILLKKCISEIHYGDDVYYRADMSTKELDDFIDNLTTDAFEKIAHFFETMPKMVKVLNVTNPKTNETGEVIIQGIDSFFV